MISKFFIFHTLLTKLWLVLKKIKFGSNFRAIGFPIIFRAKGSSIQIGNNVTLVSNTLGNLLGLQQRTILVARDGGKISIGNNCGISGMTIHSIKSIKIGNYLTGGANSKIIDHDFHPLDAEERKKVPIPMDKVNKEEIKIGDNVFIGTASIILRGTEIGDNCVIGAGSIVKGKFPKGYIIAGNPAKIIKKLE